LHIFSNILDIDLFSMNQLLKILSNNFKGLNYFVITSPYVDVKKTSRISSFVKYFSGKKKYYEFVKIEEKNGEWQGTNWSRIIRVFKTTI